MPDNQMGSDFVKNDFVKNDFAGFDENENKEADAAGGKGILSLAYLGDAVIELYVREYLLKICSKAPGELVKLSKRFITLEAQSDAVERILPLLSEKELSVFKRGRNAKTRFTPAHGELIQYRRATGLEALFGYLHMNGEQERVRLLFSEAYKEVMKLPVEPVL